MPDFSRDLKVDLNKLEKSNGGVSNSNPLARARRKTVSAQVGVGSSGAAEANTNASGLESPLTMLVTAVQVINIPVPTGATSVDVAVIQAYKLIDASGEEFDVTVQDYP